MHTGLSVCPVSLRLSWEHKGLAVQAISSEHVRDKIYLKHGNLKIRKERVCLPHSPYDFHLTKTKSISTLAL